MALTSKTLFLYGFQIGALNSSIDFRAASGGPILQATLTYGFYSLTTLLLEIKRAMNTADPANEYAATADRTINSGSENRVTITTNGAYLDLLFLTGPRAASSVCLLIGFTATDKTGSILYTGTYSSGIAVTSDFNGYTYVPQEMFRKVFGNANISASGVKEVVSYGIQRFISLELKYEPENKVLTTWSEFFDWAIKGREFEITPMIATPSSFYPVTLDATGFESKGLGMKWIEHLPEMPFLYHTGNLTMRIVEV